VTKHHRDFFSENQFQRCHQPLQSFIRLSVSWWTFAIAPRGSSLWSRDCNVGRPLCACQ
jgi:hypothetical protein